MAPARAPRASSRWLLFLLVWLGIGPLNPLPDASGQVQSLLRPPSPLTLEEAIDFGIAHYPSVRASLARVAAAQSGVDLTRTAYLPRVEIGAQQHASTFNKVNGLFFMTSYTPPVWGAIRDPGVDYRGAWGSAAGVSAGWEPFDFGLRAANVESARAAERQTAAGVALTKLDVALGVGEAFFTLLMMQQTVEAMKANVERRQIFADSVAVLVRSGLRPGVDSSRAAAELAMARTQWIQAEQAAEVARATLAEVLGVAGEPLTIVPGPLLTLPSGGALGQPSPWAHPQAVTQKATAEVFRRRAEALDRAWVPRFEVLSIFFTRGSSWDRQGNVAQGFDGLVPDVPNWAAGFALSFQLMDFASIRAKRSIERHHEQAELATYEQVLQAVTGKHAKARATVLGARRIADNTPVQLSAARETEGQARARYQAGLATVIEVADAQQLVVQASIDDALARLGVWRSMLGLAGAAGDVMPFLDLVRGSGSKGR